MTSAPRLRRLMAFQNMQIKGPGGQIRIDAAAMTLKAPGAALRTRR